MCIYVYIVTYRCKLFHFLLVHSMRESTLPYWCIDFILWYISLTSFWLQQVSPNKTSTISIKSDLLLCCAVVVFSRMWLLVNVFANCYFFLAYSPLYVIVCRTHFGTDYWQPTMSFKSPRLSIACLELYSNVWLTGSLHYH